MSSYVGILDDEIKNIQHLLVSVPFSPSTEVGEEPFLAVYRLTRSQLVQLNEQPKKFPIDSNRLLKLGISLGNLIKTLQQDEEIFHQQHQQQKQFIKNLNGARVSNTPTTPSLTSSTISEINPFNESQAKPIVSSATQTQPIHQIKFIKSLLALLKNFDIGGNPSGNQVNSINQRLNDISTSQSNSTLNQMNGHDASSRERSAPSPIKINSKQLLIEKLEINIKLDNLFIYKVVLKMVVRIFQILKQNLVENNLNESTNSISRTSTHDFEENSSIFSSTSANSSDSSSLIPVDEYLKLLKQILNRILFGLIEPFVKLILNELLESSIQNDFNSLINTL